MLVRPLSDATGSTDDSAHLRNTATGEDLRNLRGHVDGETVVCNPDGTTTLTASSGQFGLTWVVT